MIKDALDFALVLFIGSGGQLVDGMLGMGFGVFSASLLLATGLPPTSVVPTVNMAKIVTGLLSGLGHWREGNVRRDWLLPLLVPGVMGGIFGAYLLASLSQDKFRFWMAVVLVWMGMLMLWRALFADLMSFRSFPGTKSRPFRHFVLSLLGLAGGLLNAVSGAYGPFATSAVMLASKAKPSEVVGTVNFAEFFVASAVVTTFLAEGGLNNFSLSLALALTLGGAITAPLAAHVCRRLPPRVLQLGVGLALISLNLRVVISSMT